MSSGREDRLEVLRMLEAGKIGAEEAVRLLEALESGGGKGPPPASRRKFLRVRVREGEQTRVNVNLPIELARIALRFLPRGQVQVDGKPIDLDEIVRAIEEGAEGRIVEVDDGDGTRVEVVVDG